MSDNAAPQTATPANPAFRWIMLAVVTIALLAIGWMLNDIRLDIKANMKTVDSHLPEILTKVDKTSDTVVAVADDIAKLRDLAGLHGGNRDSSIVVFADKLLDLVENSGAQIGLTKKIFGSGLKSLTPAKEWAISARREALYQSFRVRSRQEMLEKLSSNLYGSNWYIQFEGKEPQKLVDWWRTTATEVVPPVQE